MPRAHVVLEANEKFECVGRERSDFFDCAKNLSVSRSESDFEHDIAQRRHMQPGAVPLLLAISLRVEQTVRGPTRVDRRVDAPHPLMGGEYRGHSSPPPPRTPDS